MRLGWRGRVHVPDGVTGDELPFTLYAAADDVAGQG
jgi:hypothetical protein